MSKKVKLLAQHQFRLLPEHTEVNNSPSQTVPDESYTMRELLDRFTRGLDPSVARQPTNDGLDTLDSPDLEKLRDSDLVDRQEYAEALSRLNGSKKSQLKTQIDEARKKAAESKKAAEEREARIKAMLDKEDKRSADDTKS